MFEDKCFACKNKPGKINANAAIKCKKCGALFHKSCAERASLNKRNSQHPCCGKGDLAVSVANAASKVDKRVAVPASTHDEINEGVDTLDPNLQLLWKLFSKKLDMKFDNLSSQFVELNERLDTLEERVGLVEEDLNTQNEFIMNEVSDRISREKNIIIFKAEDSRDAARKDKELINKIFSSCTIDVPFDFNNLKLQRLGKSFVQGKTRPLKVCFHSADDVNWIFRNKKKLGDGNMSIQADQTKSQINYFKQIRGELNARLNDGEQDLYIAYHNRIPFIASKAENGKKSA